MSIDWTPEPARPDLADGALAGAPVERYVLHGPCLGTRWSAIFYATSGRRTERLGAALQKVTDRIDSQASTSRPGSDLHRLNEANMGTAVELPYDLFDLLAMAFALGQDSGNAFDIGVAPPSGARDAHTAAGDHDPGRGAGLPKDPHRPAYEAIVLDVVTRTATKLRPVTIIFRELRRGMASTSWPRPSIGLVSPATWCRSTG